MMWAEPASAQKKIIHELTVRYHKSIERDLTDDKVKRILAEASRVLQRQRCNVSFTLKQPIRPFESDDTPADVGGPTTRDKVHREDSDVKIVSTIAFCRPHQEAFLGCGWDPPPNDPEHPRHRSMIVVNPEATPPSTPQGRLKFSGVLWAHEFGHMTGLFHRKEPNALMTGCEIATDTVKIKPHECDCFRGGARSCLHEHDPETQCGQ
jgi:hypothetical protein